VAIKRVLTYNQDQNVNGGNFNNITSETIFSFGKFRVTSNFDNKRTVNHSNKLSGFVKPITLETLGVTKTQSDLIFSNTNEIKLNLEKSDINKYIRFGSAYEYFRFAVQNIISNFPGSLFSNSQKDRSQIVTYYDYLFDPISNTSTFKVPVSVIDSKFNLTYNSDFSTHYTGTELSNVCISFEKYAIWSTFNSENSYKITSFTGYDSVNDFIIITAEGNPFEFTNNSAYGKFDFHIKPNVNVFDEYRLGLKDYERYMLSERVDKGFSFTVNNPSINDDGEIEYINSNLIWPTIDGYNIDINNMPYKQFLEALLNIGGKFDAIKTDLIARFLTTSSLKAYDLTDNNKITKLLRTYGYEFDQLRIFVDSLQYVNRVSYDKKDNVPDAFVSNLAQTFGWDYFPITNEVDLMNSLLSVDDKERNLNSDLLPLEIDIEVWRRILINTNYYWKSKGTRDAIKSIFLLIGIPEPFINITEYVYTVDGKINPAENSPLRIKQNYPTNSLPFDVNGYPVAPLETNDFYFQVSGNTDSGQDYMNVFRKAGFDLYQTIDNKKSWVQSGETIRSHQSTPQYYQEDSRLVLNTKEVDVGLDVARGIEYDMFSYAKTNAIPDSNFFINLSLDHSNSDTVFTLPYMPEGDVEVRFNGILLSTNRSGNTGTTSYDIDYSLSGNVVTLNNPVSGSDDVVEITYIYKNSLVANDTLVRYISTRVSANAVGTILQLPSEPNGKVQLTINGIELINAGTGTGIDGDYKINPSDPTQILILNSFFTDYLIIDPIVQVTFVIVSNNTVNMDNEILYYNSSDNSKVFFDTTIGKYVLMINYRVNKPSDIKILMNGIGLAVNSDYYMDISNPYKIVLTQPIAHYTVFSVYYLNTYKVYGIDNITQLSFMDFIDQTQKNLINAKNRKTITDGKGGWYPSLLKVYLDYLKNGLSQVDDLNHSNGYTFSNLYAFLNKYNAFFHKFVDKLLSPTIILRKSGMIVRNSMFTKQKFAYRRGAYMGMIALSGDTENATVFNTDYNFKYLGDDGSIIKKLQPMPLYEWLDDVVTTTTTTTTTTVSPCVSNPMTISFTSTNPTTVGASDGTATVAVVGGSSPYDYVWSVGQYTLNSSSATNTSTGLSGGSEIMIMVTDSMGCSVTGSTIVGAFVFDADYMVLTYQFTDGSDLDTRTRIVSPNIGQSTQQDYLGWGVPSGSSGSGRTIYPSTGIPILTWGGDNMGIGFEAVKIDLINFKTLYPLEDTIVVDARAFWYGVSGTTAVNVAASLYKGGTMIRQADTGTGYNFINTGYTSTYNIDSTSTVVLSTGYPVKALSSGDRVATLTYTISTGLGYINGNDTLTPSV